jgi:hypothetical protein
MPIECLVAGEKATTLEMRANANNEEAATGENFICGRSVEERRTATMVGLFFVQTCFDDYLFKSDMRN